MILIEVQNIVNGLDRCLGGGGDRINVSLVFVVWLDKIDRRSHFDFDVVIGSSFFIFDLVQKYFFFFFLFFFFSK